MSDFLSSRRKRVAVSLPLDDAMLVVGAGRPVPLPENSDQTYPFQSHAEYFYLTELECADGIVAYDPHDGEWLSFVPAVTEAERVWEGSAQLPGLPLADFAPWLAARAGRPVAQLGAPRPDIPLDTVLNARIREHFHHARRPKDDHELELLRAACSATASGYAQLSRLIRPDISERAIQIELEAEFFRAGGTRPGYGTIVGTGSNSAVLHFSPSARLTRSGDFVLVDAGAAIGRYTADVTRTYVVDQPDPFQRDLYQIVLHAQERAISRCIAGAEWTHIHLACAVEMVAGLVAMGVMRGSPTSLVEQEAHTLFFPHGLGHMVGLGVRDGSGLLPGRTKNPRPSLRTLRMDLPLLPGYVVTIEPGLYFLPPLLQDPVRRATYHDCVNWPLVDSYQYLGGVRIEDNILVTTGAPENLTAEIPKSL
ncbi:MAG: M24 family metallopeptidase [Opitutaceae bacterium]|nr:M24 family metallopeptidase [Opitutaceae bacterium]